MTVQEFSNEFDTLINSYGTTENFGSLDSPLIFDEYEKSIFLTKAQEEIVRELYSGKNTYRDSVEKTEEIRAYLNPLIRNFNAQATGTQQNDSNEYKFIFSGQVDNIWYIMYEEAAIQKSTDDSAENGSIALVVPTQIDDYYKTLNNPFKGPSKRRVLRIYSGSPSFTKEADRVVHLICKEGFKIQSYTCVYVAAPNPIILEKLPDGLKINEESERSECELSTALHRQILERAVKLALQSRLVGVNK